MATHPRIPSDSVDQTTSKKRPVIKQSRVTRSEPQGQATPVCDGLWRWAPWRSPTRIPLLLEG